jgi:CRISPR-associated protein Cmr1
VEIVFRPGAKAGDIEEICKTLRLFGLLGGLGSRVRRGWGSVALRRLEADGGVACSWQEPQDRAEYIRRMEDLFANHPGREHSGKRWPLSAIARESRLLVGESANADENASAVSRALSALDELGSVYIYRSQIIAAQMHSMEWKERAVFS